MKPYRKKTIFLIGLMLLLLSSSRTFAATQTLGGVATENTLKVEIYDDGDMQVYRYVSGSWQPQWFPSNSKSIRLYINGTAYIGTGGYFSGGGPTALTTFSNTITDANTGELELGDAAEALIAIVQTTYYPPGAAYISYTWEIQNLTGAAMSNLRFFSGGDTYLSGGDNGAGFWVAETNTIGVRKGNPTQQNLFLQANTIPYAHESDRYANVFSNVNANALSNNVDTNEATDNGMAMEWRLASLASGATWTIHATERFITKTITNLSVSAPISAQIAPGGSVDLSYQIENLTGSDTSVTLNTAVDQAGWTAVIQSPVYPFTLAGDATQEVVVRVTCPAHTILETLAKVTLQATDASGTASDISDVTAAEVPYIVVQPSDRDVNKDQQINFSITVNNATSYQWQEFISSWQDISDEGVYSGATTSELAISSAAESMDGYKYRCVATNATGSTTSIAATLTINTAWKPTVSTQAVDDIGSTTATGYGNIIDIGFPEDTTSHGICWSTETLPTVADNYTDEGSVNETGDFASSMTDLEPATTYYARAYATNSIGTSYGDQVSFTTALEPPVATDASNVTPTSFDANWNASQGASGYKLDVATDNDFTNYVSGFEDRDVDDVTTFNVSELDWGSTYYYRVRATNSEGTTESSNTISITLELTESVGDGAISLFYVYVTKVEMLIANTTDAETLFSGLSELELVSGKGSAFNEIDDVTLPEGTYHKINITYMNSFAVNGSLTYKGTTYYTTALPFDGQDNIACEATTDPTEASSFTFKINDWGEIGEGVVIGSLIDPSIQVDENTDYNPSLKFSFKDKLVLKGTDGAPESFHFRLIAPGVEVILP